MAEISFVKTPNGLIPASEADKEIFNKWKVGRVLSGNFKQVRNYEFHKRFFALMNLAFDYYEPTGGLLTKSEKSLAKLIFKTLESYGSNDGTMIAFGNEFMKNLTESRKSKITDITKSFESFRKEIMIESGFYQVVNTPTGIKKEAASISFAAMDETKFQEVYKAVFGTLWRFVLSRHFESEGDAEKAVNQMMNFA